MDADHLDIYGEVEEMYKAYKQLTLQLKKKGTLILGPGVDAYLDEEWLKELEAKKIKIVTIGRDIQLDKVTIEDSKYHFEVHLGEKRIKNVQSNLPGIHNLNNSLVACYIARELGMKKKEIRSALKKFKGIKRRFEIVHEGDKVLIDDYAHHPTELKNAIATVKKLYEDEKVLGIFQPHLYSRTSDFYRGFGEELSGLDGVIVLPIYPAREEPMDGVTSELIYNLITLDKKYLVEENELINKLATIAENYKVLITLGASDLDKHHDEIIKLIK